MLEHHIQREIVYRLAFENSLRFSELKPDDLENKLFDYHLKATIRDGLVAKKKDGEYELTSEGRRVGKGALKNQSRFIDRAYSVLFLAIRRQNRWLVYRRKTQPLLGGTGFMHAQPTANQSILEIAKDALVDRTGLHGNFKVHGHGYFRVFRSDDLESFTHFTLLICNDPSGDLHAHDENADYFWSPDPLAEPDALPTMLKLIELYESKPGGFIDETIRLGS